MKRCGARDANDARLWADEHVVILLPALQYVWWFWRRRVPATPVHESNGSMTETITFHYPPELFNLLVDAIPRLNRSKQDVMLFFRGAGVSDNLVRDLRRRLVDDPAQINKFEIARTVLERLNAGGDATLRERREVLRRIVEFTNYDTCWPNDRLKAKGLVASIREIVNQKDAFTRMNNAREEERKARLATTERARRAEQERAENIAAAKKKLYALFGAELTPQSRGKQLESALNNLFKAFGVAVREAFSLVGDDGEGIVEQVDGVVELKGVQYFVELKWTKAPVGKAEVSQHLVRLMGRAQAHGLFISASGFSDPAVGMCREFLQRKVIVLCDLQEVVTVLDRCQDMRDFLDRKIREATISKNPYFKPFEAEV